MNLPDRAGHKRGLRLLGVLGLGGALALRLVPACYSAGDGSAPPDKNLYFPVGLAVSEGGNVLYAANSDFDLQWNGGTLQSYDLHLVRKHTLRAICDPTDPTLPLVRIPSHGGVDPCPGNPPVYRDDGTGGRQPLGESCSPPVDSQAYVRDSAVIGAFATDLQLWNGGGDTTVSRGRLFVPVRGDASLTWADVPTDVVRDANGSIASAPPPPEDPKAPYAPFTLDCGFRGSDNRCDGAHHAGNNGNEPGNTRYVTMPGEPFGMAQSEDGSFVVVTHQTDTKVSLLSTGLTVTRNDNGASSVQSQNPNLQFVLDGLPLGGNGIAAVPHDSHSGVGVNQAFLETTRSVAELDLLRLYPDEVPVPDGGAGGATLPSSYRPFLEKESSFSLTANAGGTDSRGIIIDPTPRYACAAAIDPSLTGNALDAAKQACARRPARVFFTNRSPATLVIGEIGEPSLTGDASYDPDRLVIFKNVPLTFGPSRVYLAPIVDQDGNYALRLFIVCFDSSAIFVFDPDSGLVENIIRVGQGPFAMAFDPFDLHDVAARKPVPNDAARYPESPTLKRYRFAYIASFTQSYVQVVDLDNSQVHEPCSTNPAIQSTFERVVFTLGAPTLPRGT